MLADGRSELRFLNFERPVKTFFFSLQHSFRPRATSVAQCFTWISGIAESSCLIIADIGRCHGWVYVISNSNSRSYDGFNIQLIQPLNTLRYLFYLKVVNEEWMTKIFERWRPLVKIGKEKSIRQKMKLNLKLQRKKYLIIVRYTKFSNYMMNFPPQEIVPRVNVVCENIGPNSRKVTTVSR